MTRIRKNIIEDEVTSSAINILKSDDAIDALVIKVYEKLQLKVNNFSSQANKETLLRRKKNLLDALEKGVIEMNDISERLATINKELSNITYVSIPSKQEIKDYILEMKNLTSNRALVNSFVENIIVNPVDKTYEIKFGPSHFGTD